MVKKCEETNLAIVVQEKNLHLVTAVYNANTKNVITKKIIKIHNNFLLFKIKIFIFSKNEFFIDKSLLILDSIEKPLVHPIDKNLFFL